MKESQILFKEPMILAIKGRQKTQTRRLIDRISPFGKITEFGKSTTPGYDWHFRDKELLWHDIPTERLMAGCPYGVPGDLLWVRETWRYTEDRTGEPSFPEFEYRANYHGMRHDGKWRPSIFMPRRASRITLEIVSVRVEQLNDISDEDAYAEGITEQDAVDHWYDGPEPGAAFYELWDSVYEKQGYGWDSNPWVWVVEFKVKDVRR